MAATFWSIADATAATTAGAATGGSAAGMGVATRRVDGCCGTGATTGTDGKPVAGGTVAGREGMAGTGRGTPPIRGEGREGATGIGRDGTGAVGAVGVGKDGARAGMMVAGGTVAGREGVGTIGVPIAGGTGTVGGREVGTPLADGNPIIVRAG
jgi:hypothetical protein